MKIYSFLRVVTLSTIAIFILANTKAQQPDSIKTIRADSIKRNTRYDTNKSINSDSINKHKSYNTNKSIKPPAIKTNDRDTFKTVKPPATESNKKYDSNKSLKVDSVRLFNQGKSNQSLKPDSANGGHRMDATPKIKLNSGASEKRADTNVNKTTDSVKSRR